jgi:predicted nucleic acid-binding protein
VDLMNDRYVLDTNVALYLLSGRLANPLPIGEFYLSIISEIEMLSFSAIGQEEESRIREFLTQVTIVGLSEEVKQSTIEIRRKYRLKLPDAIVCATALVMDSNLLSNDVQLGKVTELTLSSVQIQARF